MPTHYNNTHIVTLTLFKTNKRFLNIDQLGLVFQQTSEMATPSTNQSTEEKKFNFTTKLSVSNKLFHGSTINTTSTTSHTDKNNRRQHGEKTESRPRPRKHRLSPAGEVKCPPTSSKHSLCPYRKFPTTKPTTNGGQNQPRTKSRCNTCITHSINSIINGR